MIDSYEFKVVNNLDLNSKRNWLNYYNYMQTLTGNKNSL